MTGKGFIYLMNEIIFEGSKKALEKYGEDDVLDAKLLLERYTNKLKKEYIEALTEYDKNKDIVRACGKSDLFTLMHKRFYKE